VSVPTISHQPTLVVGQIALENDHAAGILFEDVEIAVFI
jgi:hypothetical protein